MNNKKDSSIRRSQAGFTLLELLISLAITAFIGVGVGAAVSQLITQAPRNVEYSSAGSYASNAIFWISNDAQMAQTVQIGGVGGFPLTIRWTEWDNSEHQVVYTLANNEIKRSYTVDGGAPVETLIAPSINSNAALTRCEYSNGVMTLKITATMGAGAKAVSVTRWRDITPRPGL
jgi:prepilin-type N-terminal cleavage/methylation domain-containing protein